MMFTWRTIRDNRIPTASAMSEVFADAQRRVSEHTHLFLAAVFYGSVARAEHTLFSDLDWYVVIEPGRRRAREIIAQVRREAAQRYVVSHAHVLTPADILARPILFGPSYLPLWQRLREQGLVFGMPEHFASDQFTSVQEEMQYRVDCDHAELITAWQRMLHMTQRDCGAAWVEAFVRKTRRTRTRLFHFYWKVARVLRCWRDGGLTDPSKPSVFSAMFEDRAFRRLLPPFSELRLTEEEYSHLFAETRAGLVDEAAYYLRLGELITKALRLNIELHERSQIIVQAAPPIAVALPRRRAAA